MKRIWLLQFVANAAILFAFYEWLGIRDARAWQLVLTAVLGLAIVAGTVFLHSRTFHLKPLRFAVALAIFLALYWGLTQFPLDKWGLWVASTLTHSLRKPVKPQTVTRLFDGIRWILQWIATPLLLLGKRGPKFWIQYVAVVFIGFVLPGYIVNWVPKPTPTWMQVTSFVLRFGVAYCLVTCAFAAFWRLTSSGSPVESQPRTAVLP